MADIRGRADLLVEPILSIWPYFGAEQAEEAIAAPKGRRPHQLHIFGKSIPVITWRYVLENTVNEVVELDADAYAALGRELPSHIGNDRSRFRESRQLRNGGYVNVNLSAEGIDRLCRRILDVVGIADTDWHLETV